MNYPKFLSQTLQFDPHQKPPSRQIAKRHQLATLCGIDIENNDFCQCCGQNVVKHEISLNSNIIELSFLGQGIPLFYNQLYLVIVLLFVIFNIFTIPNVIYNILADNCLNQNNYAYQLWQEQGCVSNCPLNHEDYQKFLNYFNNCEEICKHYTDICLITLTSILSFPNKQYDNESKLIQSALVLGSVIILKIGFIIIRERQRKIECMCDKELTSPSDFTAILNHLPKNNYNEKELANSIIEYCETFDLKTKYEVIKINIAYDISNYIDQSRKKIELEKKLEKKNNSNFLMNLKNQINLIMSQLAAFEQEINEGTYKKTTQIAFITFQTKQQLQNLLDQTKLSYWESLMVIIKQIINKQDSRGFYFKNELIDIQRAPEPDDVFWENCGVDSKSKMKRKILSWFCILIILGVSFLTLFGLDYIQNNIFSSENDFFIKVLLSLIKSIIIAIVDVLIYYCISKLAGQERHVTKTQQDTSVSQKLSFVQFINSCLLLIAINLISEYLNSDSLEQNQISYFAIQQSGGITDDIIFVSATNAILVPLSNYFNPMYIYSKFQQWRVENIDIDQLQANKLFEGPEVQLFDQYSYLCKTTWLTLFFAPMIPISLFFAIFGLTVYYWIQKYLLLRRNKKPPFQSSHLDREMLSLMDLSPLLLSAMQFWLDDIYNSSKLCQTMNIASLVISGIELIIPTSRLNRIIFKEEYDQEEIQRYQDVYFQLPTDYDRTNPLTSQSANNEFFKNKIQRKNKSPIKLDLSVSIGGLKANTNRALNDIIYKGQCNPKKIRIKILIKKLQSIIKVGQMRRMTLKKKPQLDCILKVESIDSNGEASATYNRTPDYNFSRMVNFQPLQQQKSDEMSDLCSSLSKAGKTYKNTPSYYFSTRQTSFLFQYGYRNQMH